LQTQVCWILNLKAYQPTKCPFVYAAEAAFKANRRC